MSVDADKVVALRARFRQIEIGKARYEERKAAAERDIKEAKAKLKENGFKPSTAREEIEQLYKDCVTQIEQLEELLDIT